MPLAQSFIHGADTGEFGFQTFFVNQQTMLLICRITTNQLPKWQEQSKLNKKRQNGDPPKEPPREPLKEPPKEPSKGKG